MGFNFNDFIGAVTSGDRLLSTPVQYIVIRKPYYSPGKITQRVLICSYGNAESFLSRRGRFVIAYGMQCVLGENGIVEDLESTLWTHSVSQN